MPEFASPAEFICFNVGIWRPVRPRLGIPTPALAEAIPNVSNTFLDVVNETAIFGLEGLWIEQSYNRANTYASKSYLLFNRSTQRLVTPETRSIAAHVCFQIHSMQKIGEEAVSGYSVSKTLERNEYAIGVF